MTLPWKENWKRTYKISIGTRTRVEQRDANYNIYIPSTVRSLQDEQNKEDDQITIPSNAVKLSNLPQDGGTQRGFNFKLDANQKASKTGSEGETTTLTLYNIDKELEEIINQEHAVVIIEAGYQGKTDIAYAGDIVSVEPSRQGVDTLYYIKCASGANDFKNTTISAHYEENLSEEEILVDLVRRLPTSTTGQINLPSLRNVRKTGGRSFVGGLAEIIDKQCNRNNLRWCNYNGIIVTIPYRLEDQEENITTLTNYTLPVDALKRITPKKDTRGIGSKDKNSKKRSVQISTFFLPAEVGQLITVPDGKYTKSYAGTYLVTARRLVLESKGKDWDIILACEEI